MTTTPQLISVLVCGPTSTDATKGQILAIPPSATGNRVIRRLVSVETITVTNGTGVLAKLGIAILHNGVPNTAYDQIAGQVNLDSAVQNLLCFSSALLNTQLIFIKAEVLAPNVPAICGGGIE